MAKHTCAICGAEIGLISEQKLADGNFICRKVCSKKTFKIFDKVESTLGDVTAHIECDKNAFRTSRRYTRCMLGNCNMF